MKILFFNTHHS